MEAPFTVKERIDLTKKEEKIFQRLLDVIRHFKLETQLRVAGGWVRDKVCSCSIPLLVSIILSVFRLVEVTRELNRIRICNN